MQISSSETSSRESEVSVASDAGTRTNNGFPSRMDQNPHSHDLLIRTVEVAKMAQFSQPRRADTAMSACETPWLKASCSAASV